MFALFFIASLVLTALGACGDRISSHGHIINDNELKQINIGTTTKADIVSAIKGKRYFENRFIRALFISITFKIGR